MNVGERAFPSCALSFGLAKVGDNKRKWQRKGGSMGGNGAEMKL